MKFIGKPEIFSHFPEIVFGFSKKVPGEDLGKFNYNMSKSINDNNETVEKNREDFYRQLRLQPGSVVLQKQTHSSIVNIVNEYTNNIIGDALITLKYDLGLAISTADCTNIYIYDPHKKIIAAVHSGWAGTQKCILEKTLMKLSSEFNVDSRDLHVYLAPSISAENYEVGPEFEQRFDEKYLSPHGVKYKLDLKSANYDMLIEAGIPKNQIEVSRICSYGNKSFHSYRRDKENSGRALGVIAMQGNSE